MKLSLICLLLINLMINGCGNPTHLSKEDESLLLKDYLVKFKDKNWSIGQSISNEAKSKTVTSMIDGIIQELDKQGKINESREFMVNYIYQYQDDSMTIKNEIDSFLVVNLGLFKKQMLTPVQEFHFIDKFIDLLYQNNWSCNLSTSHLIKCMPNDTILLCEDLYYDLPIRLEYMENSCGYTILSNSLQKAHPNQVSFKTDMVVKKIQKIYFSCEVRNNVTKEIESLQDSLLVKLIVKNER